MLSSLILCLQQLPLAAPAQEHVVRPNVVVIVVDDVGIDLINAYSQEAPCTASTLPPDCSANCPAPPLTQPSIDYLVSRGVRFRNAWSTPLCAPTRSLILTGKPAHRTGVGWNPQFDGSDCPPAFRTGLQPNETTLPGLLRPFYRSAAVGKWHAIDECRLDRGQHSTDWYRHPLGICDGNPWFDAYAGAPANLANWTGTGPNNWVKMFSSPIDPRSDECEAPCTVQLNETAPTPCSNDCSRYAISDTAQDAVHLVTTLPEPFFLLASFNAPHVPLEEPDPTCCPEGLGSHTCPGRFVTDPLCPFDGDPMHDTRCMVQLLDNEIGALLCAIDESDTYVILTSDNATGQSGVACPFDPSHHKGTLYQGGIHVPLIVTGPGIAGGLASDALVSTSDFLATICDLAGVSLPPDPELDSVSFAQHLFDPAAPSGRIFAYSERFEPNFIPNRMDPQDECSAKLGGPPASYHSWSHTRAIRDHRFKLIEWWEACDPISGSGVVTGEACASGCDPQLLKCLVREEFYDLEQDFYEQDSLAGNIPQGPALESYDNLKARLAEKYPLLP